MTRNNRRVPVYLDTQCIKTLKPEEIKAILRAADSLIMRAGRSMLTKVLKGSKDKKLLDLKLDDCPTYGFYRELTLEQISARVDWMIKEKYLAYEYDGKFPLLVYTQAGWHIEREIFAQELFEGFDKLLESDNTTIDTAYLKDRERTLIMLLLDKVQASGDIKYLPILKTWIKMDCKKVRSRIRQVMNILQETSEDLTEPTTQRP